MFQAMWYMIKYLSIYFWFELKYYLVGGASIAEDIFLKWNNKCETGDCGGKVVVLTGGARGIGASVAAKLLQSNVHLIVGCRTPANFDNVVESIRKKGITQGSYEVYPLDLNSFESVRLFATHVKNKHSSINILINNAGIMFPPFHLTEDGYESQWQVNYLSPFLLTYLLLPCLTLAKGTARIVNVTSCAHYVSGHLTKVKHYDQSNYIPGKCYGQSKLALLMFTLAVDRKLQSLNHNVHAYAVHPGVVNTELFDGTILKNYFPWVLNLFCKNADEGSMPLLYASTAPSLESRGGLYISNCKAFKPSSQARNKKHQELLFNNTLEHLQIKDFFAASK